MESGSGAPIPSVVYLQVAHAWCMLCAIRTPNPKRSRKPQQKDLLAAAAQGHTHTRSHERKRRGASLMGTQGAPRKGV